MIDDFDLLAGFHAFEQDDTGPFVWTQGRFQVAPRRSARFSRITLCYNGEQGSLTLRAGGQHVDSQWLSPGWQTCVVRLGEDRTILEGHVAPVPAVDGDDRELGLMIRSIETFDDEQTFELLRASHRNLRLNQEERRLGCTVLASYPPAIRINLEVCCNIPETSQACVYCAWDWGKLSEQGSPAFTLDTLNELGDWYRLATEVNDCSIGEPTMHKQFGGIVARVDADGKQMSLTTNGQLLSPRLRSEVVGKNLRLYVSLDAATAQGYARYRNDRFDDVIANLAALCREKKAHGGLLGVYVSFIAMRSNVAELPEFFALMREVGVDEVKLRSLYLDDNLPSSVANNGYRFNYADELLTQEELAEVADAARELAEQHGVVLYVEEEQFPQDITSGGTPLCDEPWRTMYVLRRGIMPCAYATEPIAHWSERQGRPLAEFLADVFNGPKYQEIRAQLAAGRLADYCRRTPSCPVLKERQQRHEDSTSLNAYQRRALAEPAEYDATRLPLVPIAALGARRHAA